MLFNLFSEQFHIISFFTFISSAGEKPKIHGSCFLGFCDCVIIICESENESINQKIFLAWTSDECHGVSETRILIKPICNSEVHHKGTPYYSLRGK